MKLRNVVPLGLAAGGLAVWAVRNTGAVAQHVVNPALGLARRALSAAEGLRPGQGEDSGAAEPGASALDEPETMDNTVPAPEAPGATLTEVVDSDADLVEAERELLTVPGEPGEGHRRRDQTAGHAAQEIAAAQVRARRNGEFI